MLDVDELDQAGVLSQLQSVLRHRRQSEVEDLRLVLAWCVLNEPVFPASGPRDFEGRRRRTERGTGPGTIAGAERYDELGGEGTPRVGELSLCELGIARGVHPLAARSAAADALDLQWRLPLTWARVQALEGEVWVARKVAALSRGLTHDVVGLVDAAVAAAIGGQSPRRIIDLAEAKVIEADPTAADARCAEAKAKRFARFGRIDEHGLQLIYARITAGDAALLEATITHIADILRTDPLAHGLPADAGANVLRSAAMGWLARPAELLALLLHEPAEPAPEEPDERSDETDAPGEDPGDGDTNDPAEAREGTVSIPVPAQVTMAELAHRARPRATLYLHLHEAALHGHGGIARVEGIGSHTLTQIGDLLKGCQVTVKPVLDLADQITTWAYEHPHQIRERIHLLRPGDQFPHATNTGRNLELDHAVPYDHHRPPGTGAPQTNAHHSQPLSKKPHRAKTHLGYRCKPLPTGEMLWATPHGLYRIVDAAGTRTITETEATSWVSTDPIDQQLTRFHHRFLTGQLDPA